MVPEPRVYWLTEEAPPETGGTGLVAAVIAEGLVRAGVPTELLARQTRPPRSPLEWYGPVRVRRTRPGGRLKGTGWRALPAMLFYLARITWLLCAESRRYDMVVVSCMKIIPFAAVPVCRLLGKRCIVRIESPAELAQPIALESLAGPGRLIGRMLAALVGRLQRRLLHSADRVIAISGDLEMRLRRAGCTPEHLARIPNPVALDRFRPAGEPERSRLRAQLGVPADRLVALYAGRLSRAKGILRLLGAWGEIARRHPGLLLVIVGSGQESFDDCEAEAQAMVRERDLTASVRFAGASERVHEYMQAADLFICPSEYEGFGLARVEALACGLPAVVSAVGIAPEIIMSGINGFLCAPEDDRALIEAVSECVRSRRRWPQIGERARAAVAEFALERVVGRYVELCRRLAPPAEAVQAAPESAPVARVARVGEPGEGPLPPPN